MNGPWSIALTDVERAVATAVMFEAGIIPIEDANKDMNRVLAKLQPDEARKLKRKFRKLWRKAVSMAEKRAFQLSYGKGKPVPSKHERQMRKRAVLRMLWDAKIVPMLAKINQSVEHRSEG